MRERRVYCGGLVPMRKRATDLLLNVNAAAGHPTRINLRLEQLTGRLADNIPDDLIDLLDIAAYVYCADQFTSRGTELMSRMGADWRRDFYFKVPVRNLSIWKNHAVCEALTRTLSFLAEDEFSFEFVQAHEPKALPSYFGFSQDDVQTISPDAIVLFSGGLDSLTGAAEFLLHERGRVVLVSHQSSNMVTSKQNDLVAALRERAPRRSLFHAPVRVDTGSGNAIEFTQRTRSFMFAALALVLASMFRRSDIRFYENGPVSFNLPVSEHVIGARASRTTHPQFLHQCGELFSHLLSDPIRLHNPYLWLTKSEVLGRLARNQCADLISRAFSCANVRDATKFGKHCGMCSQCIDRRFGVFAAALGEHEPPEHYQLDLLRGEHELGLERTMIECYVLRAHRSAWSKGRLRTPLSCRR